MSAAGGEAAPGGAGEAAGEVRPDRASRDPAGTAASRADSPGLARLLVLAEGSGPYREVALEPRATSIGGDPRNDLALDDPAIAPFHAIIQVAGGRHVVVPGGGAVRVNGTPAGGDRPLAPGDAIALTGRTTLVYLAGTAAGAPPIDDGQRFRGLVERLDAIVWELDAGTDRFTFVSRRAEEVLGWPLESWFEKPKAFLDRIHPDDRERVCRTKQAEGRDHVLEYRAIAADGRTVLCRDIVRVVRDERGRPRLLCGLTMDVTDKRRLEEELLQSQKIEAIGRLAGGIAHDFNNILTAITGYADLLLMGLAADDPRRDEADEVKRAAGRGTALTRRLLAFSRRRPVAPTEVDVSAAVESLEGLLRRLIGENIKLVTAGTVGKGIVLADAGQLEQMILNLALNARDAMPEGGRLTIETSVVELDEAAARALPDLRAGRYVRLAVSDTGIGMDDATRARLFEPFFTTKEPGKGTGLGLSMVYGIVKSGGGAIRVASEPGRGSTFRIFLPRIDRPAEAETALPGGLAGGVNGAAPGPDARAETVLLVEDELHVRAMVRQILKRKGYLVLEAANGVEALALCETHQGPIDLCVTDIVMPVLGGQELAERIARLRPETKVILMSGYAEYFVLAAPPGPPFLPKPFTSEELARKVREVLDGSKAA